MNRNGIITCILIGVAIIVFNFIMTCVVLSEIAEAETKCEEIVDCDIMSSPDFSNMEPTRDNFIMICKIYNVHHEDIVYAQARLESANFTSDVYLENNNCLGLYDSVNKCYFTYGHWSECVLDYKTKFQYRYRGGDYYDFLRKTKYARDSLYIGKVRVIANDEARTTKNTIK